MGIIVKKVVEEVVVLRLEDVIMYTTSWAANNLTTCALTGLDDSGRLVIASSVIERLNELSRDGRVAVVIVTNYSYKEIESIKLSSKINYDYLITSCGAGIVDFYGNGLPGWIDYASKNAYLADAPSIIMDVNDEVTSTTGQVDVCDSYMLRFKLDKGCEKLYDVESSYLLGRYNNWIFTREGSKVYCTSRWVNKQIALRFLYNYLNRPYMLFCGAKETDIGCLAISNRAYITDSSTLIKDGMVEQCNVAHGKVLCALEVIDDAYSHLKGL